MACAPCAARRRAQEQRTAAASARKYEVVVKGKVAEEDKNLTKDEAVTRSRIKKGTWRLMRTR